MLFKTINTISSLQLELSITKILLELVCFFFYFSDLKIIVHICRTEVSTGSGLFSKTLIAFSFIYLFLEKGRRRWTAIFITFIWLYPLLCFITFMYLYPMPMVCALCLDHIYPVGFQAKNASSSHQWPNCLSSNLFLVKGFFLYLGSFTRAK